jgi:hypothetical protein
MGVLQRWWKAAFKATTPPCATASHLCMCTVCFWFYVCVCMSPALSQPAAGKDDRNMSAPTGA